MATITTPVYLDGGIARTAGEAMTINSGGSLTIRTDTRVHANAPASMTGYLGAIAVNEGECFVDATAVREIAFDTGTGNVPAIGTTVSQGGVSGYLLGVWASRIVAPTVAGAAMPATGFIKFREVSGGAFAAGALTGIGASATGADVPGWLEIVLGAVDITVPRLGKFKTRGDWFYLDNTTGARAQVLQVPTNGGGANTYVPGCWIETAPGSGVYDQYPALNGAANGWSVPHMGAAEGYTDIRHKFVKMLASGQMQIGETQTYASTYASVAAQASTYSDWTVTATYTLTNNVCTCYVATGGAGHGLYGGETVGFDFTSGGVADQTGTITVLDAYYFTTPITNANTSGNVTVRMGAVVAFAAHGLSEGNQVGLTVSTGTLPTDTYTIHSVAATGNYNVLYPHTTALTAGNVSALHTLTVTRATHGMAVGNAVWLDFTTGGATDGKFTMRSVVAGSYNVNYPHFAAITTSNVTERYEIGFVPASGCKVRIPNIFVRSATSSANLVPNATLASRPEFITTSAGDVDIEYLYGENLYARFGQAYALKLWHSVFTDMLEITELAAAINIDDVFIGHYTGSGSWFPLTITSCFAGGSVNDGKFFRQGTPGQNLTVLQLSNSSGIEFSNTSFGHLQYARHALGYTVNTLYSAQITFSDCTNYNGQFAIQACTDVTVSNLKHVDRFNGKTNASSPFYAISLLSGTSNVTVDGVTWLPGENPYNGVVLLTACTNVKIRNIGSYGTPLTGESWEIYRPAYLVNSAGNNNNVKIQRCYMGATQGNLFNAVNSDKNFIVESSFSSEPYMHSVAAVANRTKVLNNAALNCVVKGLSVVQGITGQASVYGTHFHDLFMGKTYGQVALCMNEPTVETAAYFSMVSGTAKFTSAGGILMGVIGDQAVWEMPYFALGHTGFVNEAVAMSGGTIGNYTLEYQIDTGSGYSAWKTLNGTNLSGETISPSTGFKLKIRITTTTTNAAAITFLRIRTTTTEIAQSTNFYPLDTNTVTFTGLPVGTEVRVRQGSKTLAQAQDVNTGSYIFSHSLSGRPVRAQFTLPGYVFEDLDLTLVSSDISIGIIYSPDPSYSAS